LRSVRLLYVVHGYAFVKDEDWLVACCPKSQGPAARVARTKEEARDSLAGAIALILDDRREDALRGVPSDAIRDTVIVP